MFCLKWERTLIMNFRKFWKNIWHHRRLFGCTSLMPVNRTVLTLGAMIESFTGVCLQRNLWKLLGKKLYKPEVGKMEFPFHMFKFHSIPDSINSIEIPFHFIPSFAKLYGIPTFHRMEYGISIFHSIPSLLFLISFHVENSTIQFWKIEGGIECNSKNGIGI